jgi:hypothetical protein
MTLTYSGVPITDDGGAQTEWSAELLRNRRGIGYGVGRRPSCQQLGFRVNGPADADLEAAVITSALRVQGGDLVLSNDDGSPSFKYAISANTFGGVRCVRGPV